MPKCIIKTVFIAKRKQNEKNGMNYLKRDEKELLVRCFLIGRRNNYNTSLFIIISHCFTVRVSNQLTFWPKKMITGLNNHHRCTYYINWPFSSAFLFVYQIVNTKLSINSSLTKTLTVKGEKSTKDSCIAVVAVQSKNEHIKQTKLYSNGSPVHVNPSPVNPALHAHA